MLLKGKWSTELEGYIASEAKFYQHNGSEWKLVSEQDHKINNVLKIKEHGGNNLYIELKKKLNPVNTMMEKSVEGKKVYSNMTALK